MQLPEFLLAKTKSQATPPRGRVRVHIRWLIRNDMPAVLGIEQASHASAWHEEEFLSRLRQRNTIGMVAEHDDQVVGFMIYDLRSREIRITNLAVDPQYRRRGVGTALLAKLQGKLSTEHRPSLSCVVRETNLGAQQFFRASAVRAISVCRHRDNDGFPDTGEDGYLFRYDLHEAQAERIGAWNAPEFMG